MTKKILAIIIPSIVIVITGVVLYFTLLTTKIYQVTFYNEQEIIQTQHVKKYEDINFPKLRDKEESLFKGWLYNDREVSSFIIDQDIILVAKYVKKTFKVTIDGISQDVSYSDKIVFPDVDEEHLGFFYNDKLLDVNHLVMSDMDIISKTKKSIFKVTIDGEVQDVLYGHKIIFPKREDTLDSKFIGFFNNDLEILSDYLVTSNLNLTSKYTNYQRIIYENLIFDLYNGIAELVGFNNLSSKTLSVPERVLGYLVVKVNIKVLDDSQLTSLILPKGILRLEKDSLTKLNTLVDIYIDENIEYINNEALNIDTYIYTNSKEKNSNWHYNNILATYNVSEVIIIDDNYYHLTYLKIDNTLTLFKISNKQIQNLTLEIPLFVNNYLVTNVDLVIEELSNTDKIIFNNRVSIKNNSFSSIDNYLIIHFLNGVDNISRESFNDLTQIIISTKQTDNLWFDKLLYNNLTIYFNVKDLIRVDNSFYLIIENEAYLFNTFDDSEKLIIPDRVKTHEVVGILELKFYNYQTLNYIKIPKTIKSISNYAFSNFKELNFYSLNDSIESIGIGAFNNNAIIDINLEEVKLSWHKNFYDTGAILNFKPKQTISDLNFLYEVRADGLIVIDYLGTKASLIEIPNNVNGLDVISIRSLNLNKNEQDLILKIPNTIKIIKSGSLNSYYLKEVTIPNSVLIIERNSFNEKTIVKSEVEERPVSWSDDMHPNSELVIYGFLNDYDYESIRYSLTTEGAFVIGSIYLNDSEIQIPNQVANMPVIAVLSFSEVNDKNYLIKKVNLNNELEYIASYAFNTIGLEYLFISKEINNVYKEILFYQTAILTDANENDINIDKTNINVIYNSMDYFVNEESYSYTIINDEVIIHNLKEFNFHENKIIVPEEIKGLPVVEIRNSYSPYYLDNNLELVLPSKIRIIGDFVFYYITNLKLIKIPHTVEKVGRHAFNEVEYLYFQGNHIPDDFNLNNISYNGFQYFNYIQDIIEEGIIYNEFDDFIIIENLKGIKNKILYLEEKLTDKPIIGILNGITDNNLEAIYLPSSIEFVASNAFKKYNELKVVYLPHLDYIGRDAFNDKPSLYLKDLELKESWDTYFKPTTNNKLFFNSISYLTDGILDYINVSGLLSVVGLNINLIDKEELILPDSYLGINVNNIKNLYSNFDYNTIKKISVNKVTNINDYAFSDFNYLEELYLDKEINYLGFEVINSYNKVLVKTNADSFKENWTKSFSSNNNYELIFNS